jgi:hypothetical protein
MLDVKPATESAPVTDASIPIRVVESPVSDIIQPITIIAYWVN